MKEKITYIANDGQEFDNAEDCLAHETKDDAPLTQETKAELFDYMASRLDEAKLITNFGGSEWVYHEKGSSKALAAALVGLMKYENHTDEDE